MLLHKVMLFKFSKRCTKLQKVQSCIKLHQSIKCCNFQSLTPPTKISYVGNPNPSSNNNNLSNLLTGLPKGEAGKNKDRYNSTLQILKRFGNECASAIFDFSTAICGSLFCLHLAKVFNVQGLFMKNCLVKKFVLPLSLFCLLYFLGFSTRNVSNLSTF